MKKPPIHVLVIITCAFAAFLGGFFVGRNVNRTPVQISTMATAPLSTAGPEEDTILDINTASVWQLQMLPGIGPELAQRIVDYRTEHGPFRVTGDLLRIDGIGTKKLEAILDLITVGG